MGIPQGTAANRLRKAIIFSLLVKLKENICFQCKREIETVEQLSVEHKIPYLDSNEPLKVFLDISNIAFSHLKCNIGAARKNGEGKHPSINWYKKKGCRCDGCRTLNARMSNKYRRINKEMESKPTRVGTSC